MLKIRREQLNALAGHSQAAFMQRLKQAVLERHAALVEGKDAGELDQILEDAIRRGKTYNFAIEIDLYEFAVLTLLLGVGFEESLDYQWAGEVLRDGKLDADAKLFQIRERLKAEHEEPTHES